MKRRWEKAGGIILAACMVLAIPPVTAAAVTNDPVITGFQEPDAQVSWQTVEKGTPQTELELPGFLSVWVTREIGVASGSEAVRTETEESVEVYSWTSSPAYDKDTAGEYRFAPWLKLPADMRVKSGITPPNITVTVKETLMPAELPGLTVGGVEVTESNADNITGSSISGSVRYNAETRTLTLNNASVLESDYGIGIQSDHDLTIRLIGNNVIGKLEHISYSLIHGVWAGGSTITLTGSGNLTVYDHLTGIEGKNVTVNSTGRITVNELGGGRACCLKADGGTLTINSGTLKLTSQVSNALYGDRIVINGGTITASAGNTSGDGNFAFNRLPEFGEDFRHRIYAGSSASDAYFIASPTETTFTASNYVRIESAAGGSNNGGGSESSGNDSSGGSGSGGFHSSKSSSAADSEPPETPGSWNQDNMGWKFTKPDGSHYANEWIYAERRWYRTGADGYMQQGWNTVDGRMYYLVPVSGEMKTGWLLDNGAWYYLEESGAMKTGWIQTDGKWYYLSADGKMASDTVTPDGYKVGSDGAWMQ